MKKALLYTIFLLLFAFTRSQAQTGSTFLVSLTKTQLDSVLNANGIPAAFLGTTYGVTAYKVVYNTVSYDSSATIASGLVAYPNNLDCSLPIVSYAHSPSGNRNFVPSRLAGQEALIALVLASTGNIAISPDYLGLGDGPGFHPFMHAKSEGTATVDLVRAARLLSDTLGVEANGEVLFSGYSQGGQAAMAAHKLCQEKLQGEIEVTASFPMSGAYSMSTVMKDAMLTNPNYPEPAFLAYMFYAYNRVYNLYDSLEQVLAYPYDSLLPPIFDGSQSFYSISDVVTGAPYSIFKPDTLAVWLSDSTHPFRLALKDNDLDNWAPDTILRMVYCTGDTYVPADNATQAYAYMAAHGAMYIDTQNISPTFNHEDCAQLAILATKEHLDDNANTLCETAVKDISAAEIQLFPNPSNNVLFVKGADISMSNTQVYSADGQSMALRILNNGIDVSSLASGLYLLRLTVKERVYSSRFAVQH